jgi:hypothetical protein
VLAGLRGWRFLCRVFFASGVGFVVFFGLAKIHQLSARLAFPHVLFSLVNPVPRHIPAALRTLQNFHLRLQ